jgi:hypothetical protein
VEKQSLGSNKLGAHGILSNSLFSFEVSEAFEQAVEKAEPRSRQKPRRKTIPLERGV